MAVFECVRYPRLRVSGVERRFDAGRLETADPGEVKLLERTPEVRRVDGYADEGFTPDIAAARPEDFDVPPDFGDAAEEGRVARHQGRGWYRFDDEGDDGRAYRRDDLEAEFPDALILDDEGDRE